MLELDSFHPAFLIVAVLGVVVAWLAYRRASDQKAARAAREALAKSEERFAKTFQASPDSILITRMKGGAIVEANDAFLRQIGGERQQVVGTRIVDWLAWTDPSRRGAYLEKLREEMEITDFEARFRLKDGREIDVLLSGRPIEFDGESCALSVSRNVTEINQVEQARRESERLLRRTIDTVPGAIAYVDKDQRVRISNNETVRMMGIPMNELIGKSVREIRGEAAFATLRAHVEAALAGKQVEYEAEVKNAHGKIISTWTSYTPYFAETGEVLGYFALMIDVSERKRAENELIASKARLEGIIEMAPDAVIGIDSDQRIRLFNRGADTIFGFTSAEAIGQPLEMLLPEKTRENHGGLVEGFRRSAKSSRIMNLRGKVAGRRKDGEEFPAEASISKLELAGETVMTVMLRDISAREVMEA